MSDHSINSVHQVGLLLAAGQGARYAARKPGVDKLEEPLACGLSVLQASAQVLCVTLPQVLAVVHPAQTRRAAGLRRLGCEVICTEASAQGMGASLAAGVQALLARSGERNSSGSRVLLVALADMPWVRADTIRAVAACVPQYPIAAPVHQGQRGHPVAFAESLWPGLASLTGDVGARALLAREAVHAVPTDDAGVLRDIDQPEDLLRASGSELAPR